LRGKCDDIKIVSRNTSDNCCLHNFSWLKWGNSWNKTKQDIGLKYTVLFYCVLCSCWIHCTILLCIMFMLNTLYYSTVYYVHVEYTKAFILVHFVFSVHACVYINWII
jgi:hypothetical protein